MRRLLHVRNLRRKSGVALAALGLVVGGQAAGQSRPARPPGAIADGPTDSGGGYPEVRVRTGAGTSQARSRSRFSPPPPGSVGVPATEASREAGRRPGVDPGVKRASYGSEQASPQIPEAYPPAKSPPKSAPPPAAVPFVPSRAPVAYPVPSYVPVYPAYGYAPQAVAGYAAPGVSVPNFFLPSAPATVPSAPPLAMPAAPPASYAAVPMTASAMPVAVVPPASAFVSPMPAGVAGFANRTTSLSTLGSRSRVRVRSRPFGRLATRLGEALQSYGRQTIETSQEVELAASTPATAGVTNISTTSAIPQPPQAAVYHAPAPPPAAPEVPPPPTPSPQGTPHGHFHHFHRD